MPGAPSQPPPELPQIDILGFNIVQKLHIPDDDDPNYPIECKGHVYVIEARWKEFSGVVLMKLVSELNAHAS